MFRSCGWCCALVAGTLSLVASPWTQLVADDKPGGGEIAQERINVTGLVSSTAAANELVELCVGLVEPASWEQAGGAGKIKAGRAAITVTNSKSARGGVRALVAALGKLPALDEKSASAPPKAPRLDVGGAAEQKSKLVVYNVADLVWDGDKAPAHFDTLVLLIETCIAPGAWAMTGGDGDLKPFAARGALVVRANDETLAAIDGLLAAVRKLPKAAPSEKKIDAVATVALAKSLGPKADGEARLYHIADLAAAGGATTFNGVIQRLMDNAAAESWQRNGGDGSLRKLADRGALVIINSAAAHGAIEAELAKMRAELAAAEPPKPKPMPKNRPAPK